MSPLVNLVLVIIILADWQLWLSYNASRLGSQWKPQLVVHHIVLATAFAHLVMYYSGKYCRKYCIVVQVTLCVCVLAGRATRMCASVGLTLFKYILSCQRTVDCAWQCKGGITGCSWLCLLFLSLVTSLLSHGSVFWLLKHSYFTPVASLSM